MAPHLFKVDSFGAGFLAVMAKPVAAWLEDEICGLSAAGVKGLASLLETEEIYELGLNDEQMCCTRYGIEFVSFPIADRGVPADIQALSRFSRRLFDHVDRGKNTVIHCRAGIDRTGLVAASVLLHGGVMAEEAFGMVSRARGVQVPDTEEQSRWVIANQRQIISGI